MITIDSVETYGWEAAIRGMRNPMNSWDRSDSAVLTQRPFIGHNDMELMRRLIKAGTEHRKFLRMIHAQMDITAPIYWWKEFDTYKVGTVSNSCSTMHKLTAKEFETEDFSMDQMNVDGQRTMNSVINTLNKLRADYFTATDTQAKKEIWYTMIQLLPSSYDQKRTVDFNYETALSMITQRQGHKLEEWRIFIKTLVTRLTYFEEFVEAEY